MNHIYQGMHGWFNYSKLYLHALNRSNQSATFVEVGTWQGKSAAFMAVELINSKKNIKLHCVDAWDPALDADLANTDMISAYNTCCKNLTPFVCAGVLQIHRGRSVDMAAKFDDHSVDFVFIDGAHDFESVAADIKAWIPKVSDHGMLAGHDIKRESVQSALRIFGINYKVMGSCWYIEY